MVYFYETIMIEIVPFAIKCLRLKKSFCCMGLFSNALMSPITSSRIRSILYRVFLSEVSLNFDTSYFSMSSASL